MPERLALAAPRLRARLLKVDGVNALLRNRSPARGGSSSSVHLRAGVHCGIFWACVLACSALQCASSSDANLTEVTADGSDEFADVANEGDEPDASAPEDAPQDTGPEQGPDAADADSS